MVDSAAQPILLVEDSEDDVFIFNRVLMQAGVTNPVQVVYDGEEALAYLGGEGAFSDRQVFPLPFLVFLDLKLPRFTGLDVLQWIHEHRDLDPLVVIVLTGSAEERDITRAYQFGARSYLVKPPTVKLVLELLTAIKTTSANGKERLKLSGEKAPVD